MAVFGLSVFGPAVFGVSSDSPDGGEIVSALKRKANVLAVLSIAGRLEGANLTLATAGSPRYLAACIAAPVGEDPSVLAEAPGGGRPLITWNAPDTTVTPLYISQAGELILGPFTDVALVTHIALVTSNGAIAAGRVLGSVGVIPQAVAPGDTLLIPPGTLRIKILPPT